MNKLIVVALVCFSCGTFAQPGPKYFQAADAAAARQFSETIVAGDLKKHLSTLASDEYEGRETGERGQRMAAEYIANYYKSLGVNPCNEGSYFQDYPLRKEGVSESTIELAGTNYKFIDDFYFFPYFKSAEKIALDKLVFAGYGIEDAKYNDYNGLDVQGKVVLCMSGEPRDKGGKSRITGTDVMSEWSGDWGKKIDLATAKGATAVIFIDGQYSMMISRIKFWLMNPQMRLDYPEGYVLSDEEEEAGVIPFFFVSPSLANVLLNDAGLKPFETYKGKIDKKFRPASHACSSGAIIHVKRSAEELKAQNVMCYIEGSDPTLKNEVVVISAHYDHIGISDDGQINNGADDDGSGTSSTLEIAQAFVEAKSAGKGPRRSILILNVSGEEKGLLGSEWYSEFPVFPLENTVCDLNIDMIGRIDKEHEATGPNYVYLIGSDKLSTDLHKISEETNKNFTNLTIDYTYNDPKDPNRFYYRSDHYNFARHNIPVIFYFTGVHEDYHKPGDDVEKILFDKMQTIARLVFLTAWDVANRDEKLKVDVVNDFEN